MFIIRLHYIFIISLVLLALSFYDYDVFCSNDTNHMGGSPYVVLWIFVPVGYYSLMKARTDGKKWIIPVLLALFGTLNVASFDALDVMKSKDSWFGAGMPERPAWSQLDICRNE